MDDSWLLIFLWVLCGQIVFNYSMDRMWYRYGPSLKKWILVKPPGSELIGMGIGVSDDPV